MSSESFPNTLWDLLDKHADMLHAAFCDRKYTPGLEHALAAEVMRKIPADSRAEALNVLACDHLSPRVHSVDCLLDETDESSYQAVEKMARILTDTIRAQGCVSRSLEILVVNEICNRRNLLASYRANVNRRS